MPTDTVTAKTAIDWRSLNLQEQVRLMAMKVNEEKNLVVLPVFLIDPNTGKPLITQPTTWKSGNYNTMGDQALWTPAAGKKFRILGFSYFLGDYATTAAGSLITMKDGSTILFYLAQINTTVQGVISQFVALPNNGYLSSAANNVLNINLSAALTACSFEINVFGVEE